MGFAPFPRRQSQEGPSEKKKPREFVRAKLEELPEMPSSKAPNASRSDRTPQTGAEGERSPKDAALERRSEEPQHVEAKEGKDLQESKALQAQKEPDEDLQPLGEEEKVQAQREQLPPKEEKKCQASEVESAEEQLQGLQPEGDDSKALQAQQEQLPPQQEEKKEDQVESDEEQQDGLQQQAHGTAGEEEPQQREAAQTRGLHHRKEKEDTRTVTHSPKPFDFAPTSSARRRANSWAATVKEEAPKHRTAAPHLSAVQFQGLQDIWNLRANAQLKQSDAPSKLSRHEAEAWMMRQGVKNPDEVRKMRQVLNSSY